MIYAAVISDLRTSLLRLPARRTLQSFWRKGGSPLKKRTGPCAYRAEGPVLLTGLHVVEVLVHQERLDRSLPSGDRRDPVLDDGERGADGGRLRGRRIGRTVPRRQVRARQRGERVRGGAARTVGQRVECGDLRNEEVELRAGRDGRRAQIGDRDVGRVRDAEVAGALDEHRLEAGRPQLRAAARDGRGGRVAGRCRRDGRAGGGGGGGD